MFLVTDPIPSFILNDSTAWFYKSLKLSLPVRTWQKTKYILYSPDRFLLLLFLLPICDVTTQSLNTYIFTGTHVQHTRSPKLTKITLQNPSPNETPTETLARYKTYSHQRDGVFQGNWKLITSDDTDYRLKLRSSTTTSNRWHQLLFGSTRKTLHLPCWWG